MGRARRWVVVVGWVAVATLAACGRPGRRPEPSLPTPLVLISLDTLRADRLNCYGYDVRPVSPQIDALARDGILFENHISAAPWTIPAHVSLLTSLWPSNHGVMGSLRELREHEDAYPVLSESRTTLAEVLSAHGFTAAAFTAGDTLDARFGYGQGFSLYRTSMLKLHAGNVDEMLRWVAENASRPFFLFWHTFEPHAPYLGTAFLGEALPAERLEPVRAAVERYADRLRKGRIHPARFEPLLARRGAFNREVSEALYLGAVADADRWVGALMEELRRRGLYDRSLIVFTSDHGEEFADRSPRSFYNAHGHSLWREMVRVPLILKLPRQERAGTRVAALSRGVDVMPTALDVLRLPGSPQMQGESLRPLWEARGPDSRLAFVEATEAAYEQKAVQSGRYKYLVRMGPESVARFGRSHVPAVPEWRGLFDLEEDPGETVNLLEGRVRPDHERLAGQMDGALRRHLAAQRPDSQPARLGPEMIERLRALGYVQ